MAVVAPGMQEADRRRLDLLGLQRGNGGIEQAIRATSTHPSGRMRSATGRRSRRGTNANRGRAEVVAFGLQPLAHLDDVAMALGGQHRHLRTLAFQQGIGRDGGAMDDALGARQRVGQGQPQPLGQHGEAIHHALALVGRRARRLGGS